MPTAIIAKVNKLSLFLVQVNRFDRPLRLIGGEAAEHARKVFVGKKNPRLSAVFFVTCGKLFQVFHQRITRIGIHIYRCGVLRVIDAHLQRNAIFQGSCHFFGKWEAHKVDS